MPLEAMISIAVSSAASAYVLICLVDFNRFAYYRSMAERFLVHCENKGLLRSDFMLRCRKGTVLYSS